MTPTSTTDAWSSSRSPAGQCPRRSVPTAHSTCSEHKAWRPRHLSLIGLDDACVPDGRLLVEPLYSWAVPQTLRAHDEKLRQLGAVYKQLNAPFGDFSKDVLVA